MRWKPEYVRSIVWGGRSPAHSTENSPNNYLAHFLRQGAIQLIRPATSTYPADILGVIARMQGAHPLVTHGGGSWAAQSTRTGGVGVGACNGVWATVRGVEVALPRQMAGFC